MFFLQALSHLSYYLSLISVETMVSSSQLLSISHLSYSLISTETHGGEKPPSITHPQTTPTPQSTIITTKLHQNPEKRKRIPSSARFLSRLHHNDRQPPKQPTSTPSHTYKQNYEEKIKLRKGKKSQTHKSNNSTKKSQPTCLNRT